MRPVKLEMTAFGSYAGKTTVPFSDLRHGLYLVTGDTGAGKTTIFDAIMFALYGVASGADRSRDKDMLHCDRVPRSTDTVVTLVFLQNGREYTVRRTIHFSRVRGTEDRYRPGEVTALLSEPGKDPISGATNVTARCEELLGLNAEQFRKIVMLAQGEFREFLKADSDKKNEILGKLFDNSAYLGYENLLDGARDMLARRRQAEHEGLLRVLTELPIGEDASPEERELYAAEHPALRENLRARLDRETAAGAVLRQERDEAQRTLSALNEKKGEAESVNARLGELEGYRRRAAELEAMQDEQARRRVRFERAETALRRVRPRAERAEKAARTLEDTLAGIEALRTELTGRQTALSSAQKAAEADAALEERLESVNALLLEIETRLPEYETLRQRQAEKTASERAAQAAGEQISACRRTLEEERARAAALRDKLALLSDADARFTQADNELKREQEKQTALIGEGGVLAAVAAVRLRERELEEERSALTVSARDAAMAMTRYDDLYQRFIAGQAGLLAGDLARELREKGEARCPVCRTKLRREQIDSLARPESHTPTQQDVDKAKDEHAACDALRFRHSNAVRALEAEVSGRRESALRDAAKLLPGCGDWETLSSEGFLSAAAADLKARVNAARTAREAALSDRTVRDGCRAELEKSEERCGALEKELTSITAAAAENAALARELDAAIGEQKKQLRYPGEDEAKAAEAALQTERAALGRELGEHRAALETARSALDRSRGALAEKEGSVAKLTGELAAAREDMQTAIREAGFADGEEVRAALAPVGETDPETWLKAESAAISAFDNETAHIAERIRTLTEQTRGKTFTDSAALAAGLEAAAEALNDSIDRCAAQENVTGRVKAVLEKAAEYRSALAAGEPAWQRLSRLGELAAARMATEGGRLSFDRYVMGAVFREILESANRRLDVMSGGRYELVHNTSVGHSYSKAGLEIDVLDLSTGQRRPSGSLSGGEAFFTSLALALGLSDVVQNHAGGRRLDTLFIDEGFGSLSDDVLDRALDVLNGLTEGDRLVDIISHVDRLGESIPQKIRVRNTAGGSVLSLELS